MNKSLWVFSLLFSLNSAAETIVEKRLREQKRLVPLEKVTVGPYDNYHADLSEDGKNLVYTRKIDLSPYIFIQSVKGGRSRHLLSERDDAEQPVFSGDGKYLAFTYYKNRSFGEICFLEFSKENAPLKCLPSATQQISSPFWVGKERLGYLRTNIVTQQSEIIVQDVGSRSMEVLAKGKLSTPSMSSSGRYLAYTLTKENQRSLVVEDLFKNKKEIVQIRLPGVSGFPRVSSEDRFVYFSQYLSDTNGDQIIDGNDHSVIFRFRVGDLFQGRSIFPQQVTSLENNCSFPRIRRERLYLTCAFQGSLDIYSLPESGALPLNWNLQDLWSAHRTARTYAERILILNNIRYRFPRENSEKMYQRMLSNHYHDGNLNAFRYYLDELKDDPLIRSLDILAQAKLAHSRLTSGELTPEFLLRIRQWRGSLPDFAQRSLFQGYLDLLSKNKKMARELFSQVRLENQSDPFLWHLYLDLAHQLYRGEMLFEVYQKIFSIEALQKENRIFYGIEFLKEVHSLRKSEEQRISILKKMKRKISDESIETLIEAEIISSRIAREDDDKKAREIYKELDQLIRATRSQYYLKRAIYTRSIYIFAEANRFRFLNFVANNWLRFTKKTDTEFSHAREHLVFAARDRGYSSFARKNLTHASNLFYQSLSLTDDLESHYSYIKVMLDRKKKEEMQRQYENLEKRKFLEENIAFVEALLLVMQDRESSSEKTSFLEEAVEKLQSMSGGYDSAVHALLLGYCQFEILERTSKGLEYNIELMQDAHRHLMLAYDLGRDNDRILSSSLMNLGLLHLRIQSYRFAVQFLEKRGRLPFIDSSDRRSFLFVLARAYYFNNQALKASETLQEVVENNKISEKERVIFSERQAFYLMVAGHDREASQKYRWVLERKKLLSPLNQAKVYLNLARSQINLGKKREAQQALETGYPLLEKLKKRVADEHRWLPLLPLRIELHYTGYLAQLTQGVERFSYLQKRKEALLSAKKQLTELSMKESRWFSHAVQNRLQIAEVAEREDVRIEEMKGALRLTEEFGESEELWLGEVFYQSAKNGLAFALTTEDRVLLKKSVEVSEKIVKDYLKQKTPSQLIAYQTLKMQILLRAAQKKIRKPVEGKNLWETPAGKVVLTGSAKKLKELQSLERVLSI